MRTEVSHAGGTLGREKEHEKFLKTSPATRGGFCEFRRMTSPPMHVEIIVSRRFLFFRHICTPFLRSNSYGSVWGIQAGESFASSHLKSRERFSQEKA